MHRSSTVIRGREDRKRYAILLHRQRAAVTIQKWTKGGIVRKEFKEFSDAAAVVQGGNIIVPIRFNFYKLTHEEFEEHQTCTFQ